MNRITSAMNAHAPEANARLAGTVRDFAVHWRTLVLGPIGAAVLAYGVSHLIAPTFTSRTSFLPPQQQQSAAASALASLGALSGLAGGAVGVKSPADQYVALMQSTTVSDRIIERFKLLEVYEEEYRVEARKKLTENVRITAGKRDGLIAIEVDDKDPKRAADIANSYVDELRRVTSELAVTEAQQRRAFFEAQLQTTRDRLTQAQQAMQSSGLSAGAIKAEPRAAAEAYARLGAEVTAAEVRLQTLRRNLSDGAPEVQQQFAQLSALRGQLAKAESSSDKDPGPNYVSKYRDYKYHETLFELFARQYESARLDESREGALIQVLDVATPAEKRSSPKRIRIALTTGGATFLALLAFVWVRRNWNGTPVAAL